MSWLWIRSRRAGGLRFVTRLPNPSVHSTLGPLSGSGAGGSVGGPSDESGTPAASVASGQPARTTPFIAATRGEPEPKSVVKVTIGGAAAPLPVPCFFPGVCFVVIATLLPEAEPVAFHEL